MWCLLLSIVLQYPLLVDNMRLYTSFERSRFSVSFWQGNGFGNGDWLYSTGKPNGHGDGSEYGYGGEGGDGSGCGWQ